MKDLKGNSIVVENKYKINEFVRLNRKINTNYIHELTLFLLYYTKIKIE